MAQIDRKLQKWIRWFEVIRLEVTRLLVIKYVFWSVQELIKQNKKIQKQSEFYRYLGDTYIAYAVMGVRRQIKNGPESISLARLLSEIVQKPEKISREYYRSLFSTLNDQDYADKSFDRYCQKSGDTHVSVCMVQKDLDELKKMAETCEDFADKRVAHHDKRAPKILPRFNELDQSIEFLHKLCLKYQLVLLAGYSDSLLPTYQYDWKEIFDYPWRLPEQESE
jgi:hypothetical protein